MPGAPVPECATFPSTEGSVDAELVCFDAAPSPLIRVVVYDSAGTPLGPPVFRDPITGAITAPAGSPIACPNSGIDVEILCLCDDGFDPPTPFIRQITYIEGTPSGPFDFELDGLTPYVLTGSAVKCDVAIDDSTPIDVAITGQPITVDGSVDVGNLPDDVELLTLCDNQGGDPVVVVRFLRRYEYNPDGTLSTTVDTELDGATVYVPSGIVEDCGVSGINTVTIEGGSEQSGFGGAPIVTRITGSAPVAGSVYTTSALCRRVSVYWTSTAASLGNRASVQVDAGAIIPLANAVGTVIFGTLTSSDTMGYTLTLRTNQNNDDLLIVEEF